VIAMRRMSPISRLRPQRGDAGLVGTSTTARSIPRSAKPPLRASSPAQMTRSFPDSDTLRLAPSRVLSSMHRNSERNRLHRWGAVLSAEPLPPSLLSEVLTQACDLGLFPPRRRTHRHRLLGPAVPPGTRPQKPAACAYPLSDFAPPTDVTRLPASATARPSDRPPGRTDSAALSPQGRARNTREHESWLALLWPQ